MKSLLLAVFLLLVSASFSRAVNQVTITQEGGSGEWVAVPNEVDSPSLRMVSGQVVWPDGSPVVGASVVLTVEDSAAILEKKYQSLLEMKSDGEGTFLFMGRPGLQYVRVVAAARAKVPPVRGGETGTATVITPTELAWSFGQVSLESVHEEGKVRIVLNEPLN